MFAWSSPHVLLFCLALTIDIPLRVLTCKFNSRLFIRIRTVDNLASKSYEQNVNPRRIGSDESRVPAVPQKNGYASLGGTLVSQTALWYYVGISFNNPLFCLRFVWLVFMRPVYTLRFQTPQEGVIVVCLNGFIRPLVPLRFNSI